MKKLLFSTLIISFIFGFFVFAEDLQIVIDPETKQIHIITGSSTQTPITQNIATGSSFNFAQEHINTQTIDITQDDDEDDNETYETITVYATTGTLSTTGQETTPPPNINIEPQDELSQAIKWMFDNGLTKYNNTQEYRPQDSLTREEASKILGELYKILGYPQESKNNNCNFSDSNLFDPSLSSHIQEVCSRGLFQGSEDRYLPRQALTKGQALAVIIRMLEGKKSDETQDPRRNIYHQKGLTIGLTRDPNVLNFSQNISREEIAIFVLRTKNIVQNEQSKIFSLNAMNQIENQGNQNDTLETIASGINLENDAELREAITRMYENGFTIHQTASSFQPFTILNREQAAKIINTFAGLYGGDNKLLFDTSCQFTDLEETPEDLILHIENACKQGLLLGVGNKFNPKGNISKAHFIVALIRLLEGKQLDERVNPRWKNYFELARSLEIVGPADALTFDNPITRYESAIFLYRFKIKYLLLRNANTTTLSNEIITTIQDSVKTGVSGLPEAQININTTLLSNESFKIGYIETFGTRQKIVKTNSEKYFTNNFVRYGDIYNIENDDKIGTITFIVGNGFVIEANIRYTSGNRDYLVTSVPGNHSLYSIRTIQRQTTQNNTGSTNTGSSTTNTGSSSANTGSTSTTTGSIQ